MNDPFYKFPSTPHLLWLGEGSPREDKIMAAAEARAFLEGPVIVEEKVDGANLGLSVTSDGRLRAQNRGDFLAPGRSHAQWNPLWPWLAQREQALVAALGRDRMLFGEWSFAQHSIAYPNLPDWFLAFDIYERTNGRFWSVERRNAWVRNLGIETVPEVFRGHLGPKDIERLIGSSQFGAPKMEGIYLRREQDGYLQYRTKVVRAGFRQQIEQHWSRRPLIANHLQSPTESG